VIEAILEYHLDQGVDFMILTDHGSEDGTDEIFREYERTGVAKIIRDEEGHHLLTPQCNRERGLELGTIVADRRLEDIMRGLHSGERSRPRPDAPFAGALLRRLMMASARSTRAVRSWRRCAPN
jgi:hypothetical protein